MDWFTYLNILLQTRKRTSLVTSCYENIREVKVKYGACAIKTINKAHAQAHRTSDSIFTTNICTGADAPAQ